MKVAYCLEFTDAEVASVFTHMEERSHASNKSESNVAPAYIVEDQFVEYMSKGLKLSHDHKVIFSKRSPCHRKIFEFLLALIERQTRRENALQEMFFSQDLDGSGKINAKELQKAFLSKAATLEEEMTMLEAEELLSVMDVNGDDEIKREEFVDFFGWFSSCRSRGPRMVKRVKK